MADSSASSSSSMTGLGSTQSSQNASNEKVSDDLDARQTPTRPLAAWQLREQMKKSNHRPIPTGVRRPIPKPKTDMDGGMDPSLPPAFRAVFAARQRKKGIDDFNSLASVHTTSSTMMTENTANASESDDDSDSFDGHDSFASLGEDDDDDEAYREGRNQMARQTVECSRTPGTKSTLLKTNELRFKKSGGVHGTPLDFIAE